MFEVYPQGAGSGALVMDSTCDLSNVVKVSHNGGGAYCYVWDGNRASGYVGYMQDTAGRQYRFNRNACTQPIGGATLSLIVFSGN